MENHTMNSSKPTMENVLTAESISYDKYQTNSKEKTNSNNRKFIKKIILNPSKGFQKMLQKQPTNRWYNHLFSARKHRVSVIFGAMQKICSSLDFQMSTFCLAVSIFDAVISKFKMGMNDWKYLAVVCVMMASKVNEASSDVVSVRDISMYILPTNPKTLALVERKIFKILNLQLNMVTPYTFLQHLLHHFFNDEKHAFFQKENNHVKFYLKFLDNMFALLILTIADYEFYRFTSIAVAVSVLITARKQIGIQDVWPKHLEEFTNVKMADVQGCLDIIKNRIEQNFVEKILKSVDEKHVMGLVNKNLGNFEISESLLLISTKKYFRFRHSDQFLQSFLIKQTLGSLLSEC